MKYLIIIGLIVSCANINQESNDYYKGKKGLHGFIPQKNNIVTKNSLKNQIDPKAISRGAKVYQTYCYQCHGKDANGQGPFAIKNNLKPTNLKEAAKKIPNFKFYIKISQWKGDMPGWKNHITEKEISDLEQYIKSFIQ